MKRISPNRRTLACLLLLTAFIWSCNSSNTEESENSEEISTEDTLAVEAPEPQMDTIQVITPILDGLAAASSTDAAGLLNELKSEISTANAMSSDEEVLALLAKRDKLLASLQYEVLEPFYYETLDGLESGRDSIETAFNEELAQLGLSPIYSEGMYMGLADAPLLQDRISEIASDELKLYLEFQLAYSNSLGSEYTFDNLEPEMEMVRIWHELKENKGDSKYLEMMQSAYDEAVIALTDIHYAGNSKDITIVGGIGQDAYPNGSSMGNQEAFTTKGSYSGLPLREVVKKIMLNTSLVDSEESDTLYFLTVEVFTEQAEARGKSLEALQQGIDAPHVLSVLGKNGNEKHWVYRFYSSLSTADSILNAGSFSQRPLTLNRGIIKGSDLLLVDPPKVAAKAIESDSTATP